MSDFDWQSLLKTVAPWIGTAVAGPFGGMAMTAAASALGISEPTQEKLKAALSGMTAEQSLALKQADQSFEAHMAEMGYKSLADLESIAAADRDSARKMQMSTQSFVPALLTCFVVGAFTATLILLLKFDVPTTNRDIVVYMIGQLSGGFTSALAFWLGTTRDSARKTEILAQSAPAK